MVTFALLSTGESFRRVAVDRPEFYVNGTK